jgi:hypothetical protein
MLPKAGFDFGLGTTHMINITRRESKQPMAIFRNLAYESSKPVLGAALSITSRTAMVMNMYVKA